MPARIYALAKELNLDSKDLVDIVKKVGITGKGSALASLTDDEAVKVREHLSSASADASPAAPKAKATTKPAEPSAPVAAVRESVTPPSKKPKAIRVGRPAKKKAEPEDVVEAEAPTPAEPAPPVKAKTSPPVKVKKGTAPESPQMDAPVADAPPAEDSAAVASVESDATPEPEPADDRVAATAVASGDAGKSEPAENRSCRCDQERWIGQSNCQSHGRPQPDLKRFRCGGAW